MKRWGFILAGLLVSLVLAGLVSNFASEAPDGLEHAAREGCTEDATGEIVGGSCIAQAERDHDLAGSPFADYAVPVVSGVVGVVITFAVAGGLFWLVRRRRKVA
jgi:cobalt/nickel transport protein